MLLFAEFTSFPSGNGEESWNTKIGSYIVLIKDKIV